MPKTKPKTASCLHFDPLHVKSLNAQLRRVNAGVKIKCDSMELQDDRTYVWADNYAGLYEAAKNFYDVITAEGFHPISNRNHDKVTRDLSSALLAIEADQPKN